MPPKKARFGGFYDLPTLYLCRHSCRGIAFDHGFCWIAIARSNSKKGDRIVFLGDSITAGGVGPRATSPSSRTTLAEKHKDLGIEVIGAGISGNKVPDLQKRLDKDVLAKKPTLVVIYIGINDVWHGENDPASGTSTEKFEAGLKDVIGKIKKAGAR